MSTVSERTKALRGTKRVCVTCAVRFYDLARDPMVCPACGTQQAVPAPQPIVQPRARGAGHGGKTGWRSRPFERSQPILPAADPEDSAAAETPLVEEPAEEAASAGPEDDIVLDQEQDDDEVSVLIDKDVPQPDER